MSRSVENEIVEKLKQLTQLHSDGSLSDEEFALAKKALLGGSEGARSALLHFPTELAKDAVTHVLLGLLGLDAISSWILQHVVPGATFVGLFLYITPLTLAVALSLLIALSYGGNWLVGCAATTAMLAVSVAVENVIPGARHIDATNPTCSTSRLGTLLPPVQRCWLPSIHTVGDALNPFGLIGYIVAAIYGYVRVYGIGVVLLSVTVGLAIPFAAGYALDRRRPAQQGSPPIAAPLPE